MHFDLIQLIQTVGIVGILSIVFAESGLFFGFFLPGDSLLFTAGILASKGVIPFYILIILLPIVAILGDSVGYWFGNKVGDKIFSKKESKIFNPKHVEDAHKFFVKYGKKAIVLARFVPIIRTFIPIVAGVGKMPYIDFISYNIIGGILWTVSMFSAGYFLGSILPNSEKYIFLIAIIVILISLIPIFIEYLKRNKKK